MRVLVVDDNELFLEVSEAALSASGFDVVTSGSALGFSAALNEKRPHVALIDVLMPAINGNHLVEIARRRQKRRGAAAADDAPECLFILHSNLPESDLQTLAERCGAQGYIRKSSRPGALGEQLCAFLRQRGLALPNDKVARPVPMSAFATNTAATQHLLELARRGGWRRMVFVSSGAVFQRWTDLDRAIPESEPATPINVYGTNKHCAELLVAMYREIYGVSAATVRVFASAEKASATTTSVGSTILPDSSSRRQVPICSGSSSEPPTS